jgi:hypothetical protein
VLVSLAYTSDDEHILLDGDSMCECDWGNTDAEFRVVPHDRDLLSGASIHLCSDCLKLWLKNEDEINRTETVRCAVDRTEDGTMWTCCKVVSVDSARWLNHPEADEPVPACEDCYDWVRTRIDGVTNP